MLFIRKKSYRKKLNLKRAVLIATLFLAVFFVSSQAAVFLQNQAGKAFAQTDGTPLSGWMWSGDAVNDTGVGWISLNDSTYGGNAAYDGSGNLSGYGWSSNIGWINFNPGGTSPLGDQNAGTQFNSSTEIFSGWARACSVFASSCSGSLKDSSQTGGWDGWIHLNPQTGSGQTYYWGGPQVVGWMQYKSADCVLPANLTGLGLNAPVKNNSFDTYYTASTTLSAEACSNSVQQISCSNGNLTYSQGYSSAATYYGSCTPITCVSPADPSKNLPYGTKFYKSEIIPKTENCDSLSITCGSDTNWKDNNGNTINNPSPAEYPYSTCGYTPGIKEF